MFRLDRERANAERKRQDEEELRREQRERAEREKEKRLKEEYQRKMEEFKLKKAEEDARRKGMKIVQLILNTAVLTPGVRFQRRKSSDGVRRRRGWPNNES